MPKLKGGSRAEHEVAPNASQIVSSRRPRNDLPIEEVRFAADSLCWREVDSNPRSPVKKKPIYVVPKGTLLRVATRIGDGDLRGTFS
jgi:hypothetical protein